MLPLFAPSIASWYANSDACAVCPSPCGGAVSLRVLWDDSHHVARLQAGRVVQLGDLEEMDPPLHASLLWLLCVHVGVCLWKVDEREIRVVLT